MGFPSCGRRGRCHGEWGSFSCQCVTGYTGQQCDEGKDFCLLIFFLLLRSDIQFLLDFTNTEIKSTSRATKKWTAVRAEKNLKVEFTFVSFCLNDIRLSNNKTHTHPNTSNLFSVCKPGAAHTTVISVMFLNKLRKYRVMKCFFLSLYLYCK